MFDCDQTHPRQSKQQSTAHGLQSYIQENFGFFLQVSYWFSYNCVNPSILISLKNHGIYIPQKHITQSPPTTRDEKNGGTVQRVLQVTSTFISFVANKKNYIIKYFNIPYGSGCLVF